ncbi:syntaxin-17-like isoform X2 [Tubulanus polymorphus]|uniref:syntaxin-17-like isoform X2 n=1 Tax=Tubulanus polymorphus TaxID=672921 RepID=UPI003DA2F7EF
MISIDEPPPGSRGESSTYTKFPLKRLEPTIHKFIKIVEIDLERLQRHKLNIQKFKVLSEWRSLHREHINSSRTVQQLKANIREMEKTRHQIRDEDVPVFDEKVKTVRNEAMTKVSEFLHVYSTALQPSVDDNDPHSLQYSRPESLLAEDAPLLQLQQEKEIQDDAEHSWNQLEEDLLELNGLMKDFAEVVHAQGEMINNIEDNIDTAHENVTKGSSSLAKAAKYKAALYPVAGALIGGAIGGPVGLVAGIKLGVASAVGGSILGLTGGSLLMKFQLSHIKQKSE